MVCVYGGLGSGSVRSSGEIGCGLSTVGGLVGGLGLDVSNGGRRSRLKRGGIVIGLSRVDRGVARLRRVVGTRFSRFRGRRGDRSSRARALLGDHFSGISTGLSDVGTTISDVGAAVNGGLSAIGSAVGGTGASVITTVGTVGTDGSAGGSTVVTTLRKLMARIGQGADGVGSLGNQISTLRRTWRRFWFDEGMW